MPGYYIICEIHTHLKLEIGLGYIFSTYLSQYHCFQRESLLAHMDRLGLMGKAICSILSTKSNLPPSSLILTTMLRQAGILNQCGACITLKYVQAIHHGLRGM